MLEGRGRLALTTSVDSTRKMKFSSENIGFFGPINGVVGYGPTKSSTIRIYNISTREVSPWIKSELPRNSDDEEKIIERTPYYEMGFDPATKKHKVICIWRTSIYDFETSSFEYERVCEVLTVGDITWRRIELPPFELHNECYQRKHTIYLNGFIYFCTENLMKLGEQGNDKLVAFDVGAEKFRVITVPNFILNQPRHVYLSIYLIELEGRLAILSRMNDYTAKLWVFDDAYGNNKEMNSSTSNSSDQHWTEVTIELPYLWSDDREVSFHSVAGTELIVIESLEKQFIFTRHLYNWKTKSCKEIDINGRFKYYPLISTVSTLVESLLHVR
ncbi:putative F-box protein At3g10240 [Papaver somniferum]|uniref:putative F-box protein At3g10240 n=1 Tax=Papaver somniferum TaxID=3469 RepID=UPI000E6F60CB|nr:putative F-box protein At3g10240 [Papaver somniferum]